MELWIEGKAEGRQTPAGAAGKAVQKQLNEFSAELKKLPDPALAIASLRIWFWLSVHSMGNEFQRRGAR